ncbi:MAG: response regulator [Deltaproteobacteria bacterium]|nr:response regulator [Deltaproteobacteria bacterium]
MSLKILTVDDSKTIRMIVKKAFRPYDCELLEGADGVEGLVLATQEKPDLIVLDITMPVMNGIEMLTKLKSEPGLKNIPVIMLTAESGQDNVMQIVKMGVKDYMVKPFKGEQLIDRVNNILKLEPKKTEEAAAADDLSGKYFSVDGDIQVLVLQEKATRQVAAQVEVYLQSKIKDMIKSGINKFILNLSKVPEINMSLIKVIMSVIQNCRKAKFSIRVVGTTDLGNELKQFQETSGISIDNTVEEAKTALS